MESSLANGDAIGVGARALGFAVFSLFVIVGLAIRLPAEPGLSAAAAALALGAGLLLASARGRGRAILPLAGLATAGVALLGSSQASNVGWFALCVLGAWCLYAAGPRVGFAYWVASLLLVGGEWLFATRDPGWGAWAAGLTFTMLATLVVRRERRLLDELRAAQAGLAERERSQERNRIARELHDVIAHCLTVSLLHVSGARLAVEHDPLDAARSLAEAERLGRQSLDEVRSIMGILRPDATPGELAPVAGIDRVQELAERFRAAGASVSLSIVGELAQLPQTVGATVYRIVQESLTNAAKHAPGAVVDVCVAAERGTVDVLVANGPPAVRFGARETGRGAGLGLIAMAERAEAIGGSFSAGPISGGWQVHAVLPSRLSGGPPARLSDSSPSPDAIERRR
jgi:signal transduction histidine kinase